MKIRRRIVPRLGGDALAMVFVVVMVPLGFGLELCLLLPELHPVGSLWYYFHFLMATFIMINIASNYVFLLLTDTSVSTVVLPILPTSPDWRYCHSCRSLVPPRTWHCRACRTCILKRDHHCQFIGYCIGHRNQRYFFFFLAYLSIGTVYAFVYNTYFLYYHYDEYGMTYWDVMITVLSLPGGPLSMYHNGSDHRALISYYIVNMVGMSATVFLFGYHAFTMGRGMVTWERQHRCHDYDTGSLKKNVVQVFGDRWYLTWVSPLIHSRLPSDGSNWHKSTGKFID